MASVFALILLTYQFKDQFLIISSAEGAAAITLFIGKEHDSLYCFYAGVEIELVQPSLYNQDGPFEYFMTLLVS